MRSVPFCWACLAEHYPDLAVATADGYRHAAVKLEQEAPERDLAGLLTLAGKAAYLRALSANCFAILAIVRGQVQGER